VRATTERERFLCELFDRGLVLRDADRQDESLCVLLELIGHVDPATDSAFGRKLLAHTHMQVAQLYKQRGNNELRLHHFQAAATISPQLDLASLGLFHSLWNLGRMTEALREACRFLAIKHDDDYRFILSPDFAAEVIADEDRLLMEQARMLLREARLN
jgi:tetratricopeptide (TPR) repeat protein